MTMVPAAMPRSELPPTDQQQQTPNNGQEATPTNHQQRQDVTSELRKYILLLASLVATVAYAAGGRLAGPGRRPTRRRPHHPGHPVTHHRRYVAFFYCNATAFAASLVVIVIILILAYLDDVAEKEPDSDTARLSLSRKIVELYRENHWVPVRTLQVAMVLDLLSLMGAYAAGTCRDTFTTVYSSLLVGVVFFYLVIQMAMAARRSVASENHHSGSGSGSGVAKDEEEKRKADYRFRKVLMLLATFAVSITYLAGLSTPGGFWDSAGAGHSPGDAILKDRHSTRLAVFFAFNTMAFVLSLLIIVVLLDRKLHEWNAYGFILVALVSLIGAYNAGSCRQTDTTVYVFSLIAAVLVYISFLYFVLADHIHDKWKAMANYFSSIWKKTESHHQQTDKEKAADKARSLVLLLATLAATITYQAGLDPPGGVWQDNAGGHTAGDPILLTTNPRRYKAFFYCNSVSLVASLMAIVLVQKKLLLRHHVLEPGGGHDPRPLRPHRRVRCWG